MTQNNLNNTWGIIRKSNFIIDNKEINEDYFCVICKKLLTNAHSGPCGCRYCFECVNDFTNGSEKYCPGKTDDCHEEMLNINRNVQFEQSIDKKISKLIVKCSEKECQSENELRNIDNHRRVCKSRQINCPYFNIGCRQNKFLENEIENHILSDVISHSNLLSDWIVKFNSEMKLLKENIVDLNEENKSLKSEIESIKFDRKIDEIKISELKEKEKVIKEEMEILKKENKLLLDKLEIMNIEENNAKMDITSKVELKLDENENELKINESNEISVENVDLMKEINLLEGIINNSNISHRNELEINRLESVNDKCLETFGEFQWKIENLSKIKENKYFFSEPFYSHNRGYKLCFSLVIDYVYFYLDLYLMRGDYDEYLSWPCKCDVTIDVIIQSKYERKTKKKIIKYKNRVANEGWNRPNKERNQYIEFHKLLLENFEKLFENNELSIECVIEMAA